MSKTAGMVIAAALLAGLTGCVDYTAAERYEQGLVVVLGGAGNITTAPNQIRWGLDTGGVDHAIEIFSWSESHNVLADQTDIAANRGAAGRVANRLVAYMNAHPGRPVHLIGLSAGTGIAVFALEQMPSGRSIDGVCLLASSLNDTYDLTRALGHVRNEVTNFSSMLDVLVLGVGVGVAGTVDRGEGSAAGLSGFKLPASASAGTKSLYAERLVEMPWEAPYILYGNAGDHLGASSSGFVKHFMAPIVLDAQRRRGGNR
jgi:pimeloyl-ACP methyl ester carboxylesterase